MIWFLPEQANPAEDRRLEAFLRASEPSMKWSVKNQARMHSRNGDARYISAVEAMRYWPETATAVAARQTAGGTYEIAAPFGLDDLFAQVLRPTPGFAGEKYQQYLDRVRVKKWLEIWPLLRMEPVSHAYPR